MDIQRSLTICLADDPDLRATLDVFRSIQNAVSDVAFNQGKLLSAIDLKRVVYDQVKGRLNSQMPITALRPVVGAYASVERNRTKRLQKEAARKRKNEARGWTYRPIDIKPLRVSIFKQSTALFLVGGRARDADFRADCTLSIWTVARQKHIAYQVPSRLQPLLKAATSIDSVLVVDRQGCLYGRVTVTLPVPDSQGVHPVGIDLNETNALVAVNLENQVLFVSDKATKVRNRRTQQTTSRLQRKLPTKKAERQDARGVRRVLKRLSGRRKRRTRDFARVTAKQIEAFASTDAVLVFEDLQLMHPHKMLTRGVYMRRRLALWQHGLLVEAITNRAERCGLTVAFVDPAYTSQHCARCGLHGRRVHHAFVCQHCGYTAHADINAAVNIRNRFVQSRLDRELSASP